MFLDYNECEHVLLRLVRINDNVSGFIAIHSRRIFFFSITARYIILAILALSCWVCYLTPAKTTNHFHVVWHSILKPIQSCVCNNLRLQFCVFAFFMSYARNNRIANNRRVTRMKLNKKSNLFSRKWKNQ